MVIPKQSVVIESGYGSCSFTDIRRLWSVRGQTTILTVSLIFARLKTVRRGCGGAGEHRLDAARATCNRHMFTVSSFSSRVNRR